MRTCTSKYCGVLSSDITPATYNRKKTHLLDTCEMETPSVIRGVRKKPPPSRDHGLQWRNVHPRIAGWKGSRRLQSLTATKYLLFFGLAIHQNDHQARRRFIEWAQNEIAVVPDFHKRILLSDEEHFWLNGYVNNQNGRIWSEANPQVYVETPLHPETLTVWCALWAGGILLQKR
ncbi:hypothetical protein TNCV_368181 [Trichonephila clavipes]|nr:hypothetical protein TNCV_368181 [Trichonephila clavipes]